MQGRGQLLVVLPTNSVGQILLRKIQVVINIKESPLDHENNEEISMNLRYLKRFKGIMLKGRSCILFFIKGPPL